MQGFVAAFKWLKRVAEQGCASAKDGTASAYCYGEGEVDQDNKAGFTCFFKVAVAEDAYARCHLGTHRWHGCR